MTVLIILTTQQTRKSYPNIKTLTQQKTYVKLFKTKHFIRFEKPLFTNHA